ncbi:DUF1189 family protein [Neobacillus terrae]|uniref:DUF1189 family protein n=1 Tax=Neobacillus terrae TaxID=3034837 RepID=UPI00140E54EF|nr:DUF1189 family protein [Neobacillus terrae]NHM30648.1 hypothetical protein [Neobacillus terrae]
MKYMNILKYSMLFPKKEAVLRLNKYDMKKAILYFFILMTVILLPLEINLLLHTNQENQSLYITQVLILYPFFMLLYGLVGITFLSFCGLVFSKPLKRKLKLQFLWKMTIFALTKPIIAAVLAQIFLGSNTINALIIFFLFAVNIIRMIRGYPKSRVGK